MSRLGLQHWVLAQPPLQSFQGMLPELPCASTNTTCMMTLALPALGNSVAPAAARATRAAVAAAAAVAVVAVVADEGLVAPTPCGAAPCPQVQQLAAATP